MPVPTLRTQTSSRVTARLLTHENVQASIRDDKDKNVTRVMRCLRGKTCKPEGNEEATGEMKSASRPTEMREIVFDNESSFTCRAVKACAVASPVRSIE
jgi:hypothetical protein